VWSCVKRFVAGREKHCEDKMRFSEREGFVHARNAFQVNSIDQALKNGLWNAVHIFVSSKIRNMHSDDKTNMFVMRLWVNFFKETIDVRPTHPADVRSRIRNYFFNCQWYQIYDLLEFILDGFPFSAEEKDGFRNQCNIFLERERSAWRVVGGQIARLTSDEEIAAITEAEASTDAFTPVAVHVQTALKHLSDRQNPDYRNSIKESISAVESACRIIAGNPKATLSDALKQLEKSGVPLHPALRGAFNQLYGYTSDQGGVRHSLLDESTLDFEDAKLMLVLCSSFVNFLKARQPASS
jgi:hypothetical protein